MARSCQKKHVKDRGVILSTDLRPDLHIDYVCNRASRTHGLIIRAPKYSLSLEVMKVLYLSLVRSILEFNCVEYKFSGRACSSP